MYENLLSKERKRKIEGPFTENQIEVEKVSFFNYLKDKYNMKISDIVLKPNQCHSGIRSEFKRFLFISKINGMNKVEIDMYVGKNNSFVEFELRAYKSLIQNLH